MRWTLGMVALLLALSGLSSCVSRPSSEERHEVQKDRPSPSSDPVSNRPAAPPEPSEAQSPERFARYPWLEGRGQGSLAPVDSLERRFPAPPGFSRIPLPNDSFGSFLRGLPLAPKGTPVVSYKGGVVRAGDHPNIAAVVAIDVGDKDLQQCADAVIRMHAEWRFSRGLRDHEYRAASGTRLSFAKYAGGERIKVEGDRLSLVQVAPAKPPTHDLFRAWLDEVFGWANTGALARDGSRVAIDALRPGDFFVLTGYPFGHTVLVLDMAKDEKGRRALLLGQSFLPAQSFQVLRPGPEAVWFFPDEEQRTLTTPFWEPFPFDSLRRLPE